MSETALIIWGASGHARVVSDIVRLNGVYQIAGFLDDDPDQRGVTFCGAPIVGGREQLGGLRHGGIADLIVAVGDCRARVHLAQIGHAHGFKLATAVHPSAVIAGDVRIGDGTVVAAGAVVNPSSRIGDNVIINTCASVDHECTLEEGVHIAPGAHLAGRVTVGNGTWVGIGAVVRQGVRIGRGCIIGAGAVVLNDVPDGVVAYGVPARIVREVAIDERG
jgi:sugar O-acyltransferase (sialic acid O-acetyltransferase NeuD family)